MKKAKETKTARRMLRRLEGSSYENRKLRRGDFDEFGMIA